MLFPAYAGVIPTPYFLLLKTTPFPAYAGVILGGLMPLWMRQPFPRPRGGDPYEDLMYNPKVSFSPPTRG